MRTFGHGGILLSLLFLIGCSHAAPKKALPLKSSDITASLRRLDGSAYPLAQVVRSHRATLLVWWSRTCPCVKRYQTRMDGLYKVYASRDVAVVAVDSNADDSLEDLRAVHQKRRISVPFVQDQGALLADYFGVETTPSVVLLDSMGKVRFFGWIDNERKVGVAGREPYVEDALEQLLAKHPIKRARTAYYGCSITREWGGFAKKRPAVSAPASTASSKATPAKKPCGCQKNKRTSL
ncbi:MAG: redoxin domain-containing protein [Myxococcales bacterium]|nr:redoxin domain-containing protein [Myxococcales bacterium]